MEISRISGHQYMYILFISALMYIPVHLQHLMYIPVHLHHVARSTVMKYALEL